MVQPPQTVNGTFSCRSAAHSPEVYRAGKWQALKSDQLVPGDVCALVRQGDETIVPCDMLLVSGGAVVNEAMLTGESTPQLKVRWLTRA
jgi:P-type E1-E2 ATPase